MKINLRYLFTGLVAFFLLGSAFEATEEAEDAWGDEYDVYIPSREYSGRQIVEIEFFAPTDFLLSISFFPIENAASIFDNLWGTSQEPDTLPPKLYVTHRSLLI